MTTAGSLPPGSVYTIGSEVQERRLALFLIRTQVNRGSGRIVAPGNLSRSMKAAIKTADAYLLAVEAGAKRILIPSENKRDLGDVPDAILAKIQ